MSSSRPHNIPNYEVRKAVSADAPFLAEAVMGALGSELCEHLAGKSENLESVRQLFTNLAAEPHTQYSYLNAFIVEDVDGIAAGAVIAYDGARLHELRRAFVREANKLLHWNVTDAEASEWDDEAQPDEIYIDSLFVVPAHRGKGLAQTLVAAVRREFEDSGKPLGLLVEPTNIRAKRLYYYMGFREKDVSNFFKVPMCHMQARVLTS